MIKMPEWMPKLVQDVRDKYNLYLSPDDAKYALDQLQRRLATDIVVSCASVDSNKSPRDLTFVLSGTGVLLVTQDLIMVDLGEDGHF